MKYLPPPKCDVSLPYRFEQLDETQMIMLLKDKPFICGMIEKGPREHEYMVLNLYDHGFYYYICESLLDAVIYTWSLYWAVKNHLGHTVYEYGFNDLDEPCYAFERQERLNPKLRAFWDKVDQYRVDSVLPHSSIILAS